MCIRDSPYDTSKFYGEADVPLSLDVFRLTETISAAEAHFCLLYTSDAADERSSVDLGGRRILKKKKTANNCSGG